MPLQFSFVGKKEYQQKKKECEDNEKAFIEKAYEGFTMSYLKESMPICGMDRDYDNADKYIYDVISARSVSSSVKEKARTLHEKIKQERGNG